MKVWRLIDSGPCSAPFNMALDEALGCAVRDGNAPPTFRLYGWETPSVSLGSFQKIADVNLSYCQSHSIAVVRRPTGGRGILHGDELTYSVAARNEAWFSSGLLQSYALISAAFQAAFSAIGLQTTMRKKRESGRVLTKSSLCFKSTSYGEISCNGKKIIGSAQKRWRDGFLQQGSIPYSIDHERLAMVFPQAGERGAGMAGLRDLLLDFDPERFKAAVRAAFEKTFAITFVEAQPNPEELEAAHQLMRKKYQDPEWARGV